MSVSAGASRNSDPDEQLTALLHVDSTADFREREGKERFDKERKGKRKERNGNKRGPRIKEEKERFCGSICEGWR